jgi:lipopolysaccharide/colanic/teichoic acid biosynthesis glycosyltransferase
VRSNLRLKKPSSHARVLLRVAVWDVLWGGISPCAAYLLRDGAITRPVGVATYCGIALLASLLVFQWFQTSSPLSRFYSIRDAFELLKACALVAALSAVGAFLLTRLEDAPRSIPVLHFMLLASVLLGARVLQRSRATRRETTVAGFARKAEHVLIVQASRLAWFFSKMVEEVAPGSYQIVAILDERPPMQQRSLSGYPIVGGPMELESVIAEYARHGVPIDSVLLAARPEEIPASAWAEVRRVCASHGLGLEILPDRLMSGTAAINDYLPHKIGALTPIAAAGPTARPFWKVKRVLDFTVALIVAVLTAPIALIVCALVAFDVGIPVVFWQRRVGRRDAALYLYKFRTLRAAFDRRTRQQHEAQETSALGRFLRATRLDEWPQLWNVLVGEMSLIGPRPLLPEDQPEDLSLRLAIRPGVSGWAQVCGGKLISPEEKNALDIWYIRHASLRLDLMIVFRTLATLIAGDRRDEKAIAMTLAEKAQADAVKFSESPGAMAAE